MRTVGLLVNREKPHADEVSSLVESLLSQNGVSTVRTNIGRGTRYSDVTDQLPPSCEMAVVFGGDGTLLGVARGLATLQIPILGVNLGHLGFLAQSEATDVEETVRRVVDKDYDVERRLMLEATVVREGHVVQSLGALNDAGVAKGSFTRMVTLELYVDDMYVDTYSGDGLIASTPTGSTAYSLSCGGPILSPQLNVMVITPICPHTMFSRPIVIDERQEIKVVVHATHDDLALTIDGQVGIRLHAGDVVRIKRSPNDTLLVKWRDSEFFSVLRAKLRGYESSVRSL